jgi:hypothetical protein
MRFENVQAHHLKIEAKNMLNSMSFLQRCY